MTRLTRLHARFLIHTMENLPDREKKIQRVLQILTVIAFTLTLAVIFKGLGLKQYFSGKTRRILRCGSRIKKYC